MFGGYDLVRKLSEGASAEVFLASRSDTQERVILEVLRAELASDDALRTRFVEESRARKELLHPAVARRVSGGYTDDGRVWLCSEGVGESLRQRLASRPLTLDETVRVAIPLCEGLHYLHQKGLVHGNLKPESIFLSRDEAGFLRVKLIDYGLALLRTPRPLPSDTVLVEPEYLAPERICGHRATARSDIYALGVVLYELLTGIPPFTSPDRQQTRSLQLTQPPPPLPPQCDRVATIIHKCLAKEAAHRYGSAEAVRQALASTVEGTQPLPGAGAGKAAFSLTHEGDILGSWRLERLLGEGAMGQVFLARHLKLGRQAALKVLKPQLATDRNQVRRFFQEARAVNQVSHPHIVQIHDFVDEHASDGTRHVYCVMELLEGESVRELLDRGAPPVDEALRVASQVAGALHAAHQVGVVHRDLKPDNLFLTEAGGVKVLDFGIAKLQSTDEVPALSGQDVAGPAQTLSGVVVGTPAYMAPEQASGRPVDGRTDVYALGVVLYRMLSGRLPFQLTDFQMMARAIVSEPPPPLPSVTPAGEPLPRDVREIVERCLEKSPDARFASMEELAQSLDRARARLVLEAQHASGVRALQAERPRPFRTWARRLGTWLLAASVLGGLSFALGRLIREPYVRSAAQVALLAARQSATGVAPRVEERKQPPPGPPVRDDAAAKRRADAVDERASVHQVLELPPPPELPAAPITLVINSDPAGAVVFRAGTDEVLGVTPLRTVLPRADRQLELKIVGDRGRTVGLTVDQRSDFTANVTLKRAR